MCAATSSELQGCFLVVNEMTGNCLDVMGGDCDDRARILQHPPHGGDNQQWQFLPAPEGYVEIIAKHSGKSLDDAHFSKRDGGLIHQWSRHMGKNQQWKLKPAGDGCYFIESRVGGLYLDAAYDGQTIHLWSFHGGENQKWRLRGASRTLEDAISVAVNDGRRAAEKLQLLFDEVQERLAEAVRLVMPFKEHIGQDGSSSPGIASRFVDQVTGRNETMQALFQRQRSVLSSVNIALFGRTGVGKSSLIEAMTQGDGTTVSRGESDWTTEVHPVTWKACQLLDTPGINGWGRSEDRSVLEGHARTAVETSDIVLLCVDSQNQEQPEFQKVAEWIRAFGKPAIAVLNCRNAWWRLPPRVPLSSARWTMSEQVRQHEGNIRDELSKLGLENVPIVAISCKRALMARGKEPFRGPDAVTFQKQRQEYGVERLLCWSRIKAIEQLIAEALLFDAPGIRLGMLVANVRGLIEELKSELLSMGNEARAVGDTLDSTVAGLLRILGYPDAKEAREPFKDQHLGIDLLEELEHLRGGRFEAAAEGEFQSFCVQLLTTRFAPLRSRAMATAEELVLNAFNNGQEINPESFNREVYDTTGVESAAKEVLDDAGDFLQRKVKLAIRDGETDLTCLVQAASKVEGGTGTGWRWTGRASRVAGLLSGTTSAILLSLAAANIWNPGGWILAAATVGGAILSWLFSWGARAAERKAEEKRAKARRKALASANQHVHDTFDAFVSRISEAAASTGRDTMAAVLAPPLREAVAARRIVSAANLAIEHLSKLAGALPPKEPQRIISDAALRIEQLNGTASSGRRFWLGEDWIDDVTGLVAQNEAEQPLPRKRGPKVTHGILAAIRDAFSLHTGRPRRGDGRKWLLRAGRLLAEVPSGSNILGELHRICDRDRARVILLGDYNTGKSSFIKRLLIEAGLPIPKKLQVRADPTTKMVHEYEWNDLVLIDTPGIQSGCASDDEMAFEALHDTSHIICLFQPNILGGTVDRLAPVFKGNASVGRAPKLGRCLLVLNRSDELGVDPSDSPEEFDRLAQRKHAEVIGAFARRGVQIPDGRVICMASDPFGQIGNRNNVNAASYDAYRGWDGFNSFIRAIKELRAEAMRIGADIAVLEGGMARLGTLRLLLRQEVGAAKLQLDFTRRLYQLLEGAASEATRIQNHVEAKLDALLDQTTQAHIQDAMGAATDDEIQEAATALSHWWKDKGFITGLERWEKECRGAIDRWFKRTHDEVGRRMQSKEFLRAHPEAQSAFDAAGIGGKSSAKGQWWKVVQSVFQTGGERKVVYDVAKSFGAKFRPYGAVKAASKIGRVGAVLAYVGVALDAWDWYQAAKSTKKREAARRKAAAFIRESREEVRKSLLGETGSRKGPAAYLDGIRTEIIRLRDAIGVEADDKEKQVNATEANIQTLDALLSDARARLGLPLKEETNG